MICFRVTSLLEGIRVLTSRDVLRLFRLAQERSPAQSPVQLSGTDVAYVSAMEMPKSEPQF